MRTTALPSESGKAARNVAAVAVCLTILLLFWPSFAFAIGLALRDDRYLQVLLGPLASAVLLFWNRNAIFRDTQYSPTVGLPLAFSASLLGLVAVGYRRPGNEGVGLMFAMLAGVLLCSAGFVLCYGPRSFRAALYPLACLLLMVPLPRPWMDQVAASLQRGSAEVTYALLFLCRIPFLRHGMDFSLPGLDFQVGPECSGIRSTLALLVVAIGVAYVYLRSGWLRALLIVLTVPIVLVKNAVRIVAISTLGAYVDRVFVDGPFHHKFGGLVFSFVGVLLLVGVLAGLQRIERRWTLGPREFRGRVACHPNSGKGLVQVGD